MSNFQNIMINIYILVGVIAIALALVVIAAKKDK